MLILKTTKARAQFKDLLGHSNHFLITLLIGLNGIKEGKISRDEEFHAAWNPRSIDATVERSREFALDLALVRAVDSLDNYMTTVGEAPFSMPNASFKKASDDAKFSVYKRFRFFSNQLTPLPPARKSFMNLAIAWRNRRTHTLSVQSLDLSDRQDLIANAANISSDFCGLCINETLRRFDDRKSPTFKEGAAIIRLTQQIVENFDSCLLECLDISRYVREALYMYFDQDRALNTKALLHVCNKVWGKEQRRRKRTLHALRSFGIHENEVESGKRLPDEIVDTIAAFTPEEAFAYLHPSQS